jgi:hypothetical protein
MTWIVGAASLGYAVGISDIRVTFNDGSERDCLQKLYAMSRFIAAGFAGSVRIGFAMLEALAIVLRDPGPGTAFIPQEVADCFSEAARLVFENFPNEQKFGSHVMLLGAHPVNDSIPGHSICSVHVLKSPDFVPQSIPNGEVVSIGSGGDVASYKETLKTFSSDPLSLLKMLTAGPMMGGMPLMHAVQATVERNPTPGISPHMVVCVVRRDLVQVFPNDEDKYPPSGEKIEFRMPPLATTWSEFKKTTSAGGVSANGAIC